MNELKAALLENPSPGQDDACPEMCPAGMQKSSEALSFPGVAHAAPRSTRLPICPRGGCSLQKLQPSPSVRCAVNVLTGQTVPNRNKDKVVALLHFFPF